MTRSPALPSSQHPILTLAADAMRAGAASRCATALFGNHVQAVKP